VDLRLLLRATPVDLRKPISAWAASAHVGEPSNYGRGKYLIFVLAQDRRQCTMCHDVLVQGRGKDLNEAQINLNETDGKEGVLT
jgi:hypothetical protein